MFREGLLVVISGPSGAGKGTLLKALKQRNSNIRFSVSATTRQPRDGEIDGISYFFKSNDEFESMIKNSELVEWVRYCDNYYGTPKKYVDECTVSGLDVVLEIEVEGALNIKAKFPECVSIFVLPPSFDELRKRIVGRGTEKSEVIEKRMERAKAEMGLASKYDYIVINDEIEKAVDSISCIISSEKLKPSRNKHIIDSMTVSNEVKKCIKEGDLND